MQEVIIYRNPLEASIWHSLMNGGFTVFLAVILAGVLAAVVMAQIDKRVRRFTFVHRNMHWIGGIVFVSSLYLMHLGGVKGWF